MRTSSLFLISELLGESADGYSVGSSSLAAALASQAQARVYVVGAPQGHSGMLPRRKLLLSWRLLREIRRHRPGVIVYSPVSPTSLGGLTRAALLRLFAPRAQIVLLALNTRPFPNIPALLPRLLPNLVLTGSMSQREAALKWGLEAEMLPSGVDTERFRPPVDGGERQALRERWRVPQMTRVVLHVGYLRASRNLKALLPLTAKDNTLVICVVNDAADRESRHLKQELVTGGIRIIEGRQAHIEELYRLADCYVFPALECDEAVSMPLSVLEALASGLPVVTTRFGALPEQFPDTEGVCFASSDREMAEAFERMMQLRPNTRPLAEEYSWNATAGKLLRAIGNNHFRRRRSMADLWLLIIAVLCRRVWHYEEVLRSMLWGTRLGYDAAVIPPRDLVRVEPSSQLRAQPLRLANTDRVGLISTQRPGNADWIRSAAAFYGLRCQTGAPEQAASVFGQARDEGWPVVGASTETIEFWTAGGLEAASAYVRHGGTLLLSDNTPQTGASLSTLMSPMDLRAAPCIELPNSDDISVCFAPERQFAHELAGLRVQIGGARFGWKKPHGAKVLATLQSGAQRLPAVLEMRHGAGRLILCSQGPPTQSSLAKAYGPNGVLSILPAMMALRQEYGDVIWHPPQTLANFTIDDPALRTGHLGLDYHRALALAVEFGFHMTVATIPRELPLAQPGVVRLLAENRQYLSACYHGNDHSGYEFYHPHASRMRFRGRSLDSQERALRQATRRASCFAREHRFALDPIMVFPLGMGPVELLPVLADCGFLATCNAYRLPLGGRLLPDSESGLRPADLEWNGFPVIWRRWINDPQYVFDMFVGRPVIVAAHPRNVGRRLTPLVERALAINRLALRPVRWSSLSDIARQSYLQRRDPEGPWKVWMMSNDICLENNGSEDREYEVSRPNPPHEASLRSGTQSVAAGESLVISVPKAGRRRITLTA